jgi:aspartyl protease family protein
MKTSFYLLIFTLLPACLLMLGCACSSNQSNDTAYLDAFSDYSEDSYTDYTEEKPINANSINIPYSEMYGNTITIPVRINGITLNMIFDTGASSTCITLAEANYLYDKGSLTDDDLLGETQYQTADGNLSVGLRINLREVSIGDNITMHNIEALVVENQQAPLLLGQSVMKRFKEISVDRENKVVKFFE